MLLKNWLSLFTLMTLLAGCVAGEVGEDPSKKTSGGSVTTTTNPSLTSPSPTPLPSTQSTSFITGSYVHQVSVSDPSGLGFQVRWYRDSVLQETDTTSPADFDDDPSALGTGTYSYSAELRSADGATVYETYSWSLSVTASSILNSTTPNTSTQVYAIDGVSISTAAASTNSPAAQGFNTGGTTSTRGTATDFCVNVSDVTGSGSGVQARWYDNSDSPITVAQTLAATATDYCLDADGYNTTIAYTLASPTAAESQTMKVRLFDIGTGTEIESATWNITVQPANTAPTITIDTVGAISATDTEDMDTSFTVKFDVVDQDDDPTTDDFSVFFLVNGLALDESTANPVTDPNSTGGGGTDPLNPDCTLASAEAEDFADRYSCTLQISSFTTTGSRVAGAQSITAYVSDTTTNAMAGQNSNVLTWTLTTTEVSTTPTLDTTSGTITTDGTAALTTGHNYIYATAGTSELDYTEGDTVNINLNISDAEMDDFTVKVEIQDTDSNWVAIDGTAYTTTYDFNSGTTTGTLDANGEVAFTKGDSSTIDHLLIQVEIPEKICIGESTCTGTSTNTLRVTITDSPDNGALAASNTFSWSLDITDLNPAPTTAGCSYSPLDTATNQDIVEGFPFSIDSGCTFSDTSDTTDSDGETVIYQWQLSYGTGDCTTSGYADITGATSATLTFSPDVDGATISDGDNICFRLCYGDSGTGNPADCSGGRVEGPWDGTGTDFGIARDAEEALATTTAGDNAVWFDSGTNTTYSAHYTANQVTVTSVAWAADGSKTETVVATWNSDSATFTANVAEVPYNLSITGTASGTHVFVAYQILEQDTFATATPIFRVARVDVTGGVDNLYHQLVATSKIGKIYTEGTNWYVPFVDSTNSDYLGVARQALTDTGTSFTVTTDVVTTSAANIESGFDDPNNRGVIALETLSGEVNVYTLTTGGAPSVLQTETDIFGGAAFSNLAVSSNVTGNDYYYVGAKNTANNGLMLVQLDVTSLSTNVLSTDVDSAISEMDSFDALCLQAVGTSNRVMALTLKSSNVYGVRIDESAGAYSATLGGVRLNSTAGGATAVDNQDLACGFSANLTVGDAGDTASENQKDIIYLNYRGATSTTTGVINSELDSILGKTPYFQ